MRSTGGESKINSDTDVLLIIFLLLLTIASLKKICAGKTNGEKYLTPQLEFTIITIIQWELVMTCILFAKPNIIMHRATPLLCLNNFAR